MLQFTISIPAPKLDPYEPIRRTAQFELLKILLVHKTLLGPQTIIFKEATENLITDKDANLVDKMLRYKF